MYLCFESDDKRAAYPEAQLIAVDENGFSVHSFAGNRPGSNIMFYRMESFRGAFQNLKQALMWVQRKDAKKQAPQQQQPLPNKDIDFG